VRLRHARDFPDEERFLFFSSDYVGVVECSSPESSPYVVFVLFSSPLERALQFKTRVDPVFLRTPPLSPSNPPFESERDAPF